MKRHFLLLLTLICPVLIWAQTLGTRKYSNEFMFIGGSARGMAMANTVSSSVDDVTSSYYNPAGLCQIKNSMQFSFMHSEYFAGITSFDFGAAAFKLDNMSAMGITVLRFGADNIPNTYDLIDKNGGIHYDRVTSFSVADYAMMLSYSRKYNDRSRYGGFLFRYGGNMKIIRRTVGPFANSWGFGIDAGAQVELDGGVYFGAVLKDITSTFNAWSFHFTPDQKEILASTGNDIPTHSTEYTLPRLILSGGKRIDFNKEFSLLGEMAFDITTDGRRNVLIATNPISMDPHIGLEAGYKKTVYLRFGIGQFQYYTSDDKLEKNVLGFQPTIGIGLNLKKLAIDYAFTNLGGASPGLYSHVIGLRLSVDKAKKK